MKVFKVTTPTFIVRPLVVINFGRKIAGNQKHCLVRLHGQLYVQTETNRINQCQENGQNFFQAQMEKWPILGTANFFSTLTTSSY